MARKSREISIREKSNRRRSKTKKRSNLDEEEEIDNDSDPLEELTRPELLEINRVFDSLISRSSTHQSTSKPIEETKNLRVDGNLNQDQDSFDNDGGGFIIDENELTQDNIEPGGFLISDHESNNSYNKESMHDEEEPSIIPPSSPNKDSNRLNIKYIPEALKLLGLPSKNNDILEIYNDAASSDDENEHKINKVENEKSISRIKFSKVCAVLMLTKRQNLDQDEDEDEAYEENNKRFKMRRKGDEDDENDYMNNESDQNSSNSDYQPTTSTSIKNFNKNKTQNNKKIKTTANNNHNKLIHQNENSKDLILKTFNLFFNSNNNNLKINNLSIGHEEIRLAANKLDEELTDEEIQEMLNYASMTNNSQVTLEAFENLMEEIKQI